MIKNMYICTMRKYCVFAAAALVVLAACQKKGNEGVEAKPSVPEWLTDESLPVPIQFSGQNVDTKGTPIDGTAFAGEEFRYAVLGVNKTTGAIMEGFDGGVLAKNVAGADELSAAALMTEFIEGPRYYPYMYSQGQFSFFGYRTSDAIDSGTLPTLNGTSVNNIVIGQTDILYAAAIAETSKEEAATAAYNTARGGSGTALGFSAKYIRGARLASSPGDVFSSATFITYLPTFTFEHKTSQFIFHVKTVDDDATASLNAAHVTVGSITIGDVKTTANLNIVTGELVGTGSNGNVSVTAPDSFTFSKEGAVWGEPIFLLPGTDDITFTMLLNLPNNITGTVEQTLSAPDENGFEPGKAYKFTVILQGIEEVKIVTELTDWGTPIEAGNVEFD